MGEHPTLVTRKPETAAAHFVLASTPAAVNLPYRSVCIDQNYASHSIPRFTLQQAMVSKNTEHPIARQYPGCRGGYVGGLSTWEAP